VVEGWSKVSAYGWRFDPAYVALAVALGCASLATTALGYVAVLEHLSGHRVPRFRLVAIWTRSLLARYVPGNVMMVAGRVVYGREAGVSGRASLAASVYEQAYIVGVSAVGAVGLLLAIGNLGQGPWLWAVAAVPFGLVLLHPRVFAPLSTKVLRRVGREPLEAFLSMRDVARFAAVYAFAYALLALAVWATVRAFAGPAAGGPLLVGGGFLLSFVVSMLAFVFPSGLGVREGILALVLARNLPGGVAIAAAAASRLLLTLVEVLFAAVVGGAERRRRSAVRDEGPDRV
jgi:hypothetical protein